MRRATEQLRQKDLQIAISIHALLAESDGVPLYYNNQCRDFYPRSPCGERHNRRVNLFGFQDFYPRSPCGERPQPEKLVKADTSISIHALLAESDNSSVNTADQEARFLSTLSLRRATNLLLMRCRPMRFLSTLSLRRATLATREQNYLRGISIHALLAESDHTS